MLNNRLFRTTLRRVSIGAFLALASTIAVTVSVSAQPQSAAQSQTDGITGISLDVPGITETTAQIMQRQATIDAKHQRRSPTAVPLRKYFLPPASNPAAPAVASYPPGSGEAVQPATIQQTPQTVGLNFTGSLGFNDGSGTPPDTDGAIGPTQYLVYINGLLRTFNKNTGMADGALNVDTDTFWASVESASTSDPTARYDRMSQRWFLTMIDVANDNRVLLAVSNTATITSATAWRFFEWQQDFSTSAGGTDNGCFFDQPSTGIDANAIYIGGNEFCPSNSNNWTDSTVYVVQKSSALTSVLHLTAFRGIATTTVDGPYRPQGVDNFDASPSYGYFIGNDTQSYGKLVLRRVGNANTTNPTLSGNIFITTPSTCSPNVQPNPGGKYSLDGDDDRLMQATVRNGALWTSQGTLVNSAGVGTCSGDRDAVRWYQLGSLDTTPTLVQAGTIYDSSSNTAFYTYGTVMVSGQGHAAFGMTRTGPSYHADAFETGRLVTDAAGFTNPPAAYTSVTVPYNSFEGSPYRWGDYSNTSLDPCDDMTMDTIQMYTGTNHGVGNVNWGVQVAQLKAPPPATILSASLLVLPGNTSGITVTVNGSSTGGSGYFHGNSTDTCATHLTAGLSGGTFTPTNVTVIDTTHVSFQISTVGVSAGSHSVTLTITNPDGQQTSALLPFVVNSLDTIGIYRGGTFYLSLHNRTGNADITAAFNPAIQPFPIVGDWTGAGYDTIGTYDQNNGNFALRNSNTAGAADETFTLGNPNDTPLSGRWMTTATHAGAGVYRPSNGILYVKNALSTGFADHAMVLGISGDQGIAGDWTGKGFDSVGVYRPGGITFYLSNQISDGIINGDISFVFGTSVDLAITGDWIGQGHDGVGTFRPSNGQIYLKNALTTGFADNAFIYGVAGDQPIAGHWQTIYPPVAPKAPAPLLIQKTAAPYSTPDNGGVESGNGIGG